jgi:predicted MFS family arabinose efflux permease
MLFLGPSPLTGLPQTKEIIWLAFPLMGIFQTFVFIPSIPEMLEKMQYKHSNENVDVISEKVNDAYGFIFALTNFVSPIIGAYLYEKMGPRHTSTFVAIINIFSFIYFVWRKHARKI